MAIGLIAKAAWLSYINVWQMEYGLQTTNDDYKYYCYNISYILMGMENIWLPTNNSLNKIFWLQYYVIEYLLFRWAHLGMERYGINKMYSQLCWYCSLAVIHFISHAWMMMRRIEIKWEKVYLARYLYILIHAKRKTKIPNVLFYPRDHKKKFETK